MIHSSFATPTRPRQPTALAAALDGSRLLRGTGSGVPARRPENASRAFKGRLWILLLATLALALTAFGSPAWAEHGKAAWVERQAYELSHAARDAHRISEAHIRYPSYAEQHLLERFHTFEAEAERFERQAQRRRDLYVTHRAFRRLTEDYWELRAAFRGFHGSHYVRSAFHRINEPMEALYRYYEGGNLYRDDPYLRHRRTVTPKHATPVPHDRHDRRPRAERRDVPDRGGLDRRDRGRRGDEPRGERRGRRGRRGG